MGRDLVQHEERHRNGTTVPVPLHVWNLFVCDAGGAGQLCVSIQTVLARMEVRIVLLGLRHWNVDVTAVTPTLVPRSNGKDRVSGTAVLPDETPHVAVAFDSYGFGYDRDGNLLDSHGYVIKPVPYRP